jgi:hypothetical protein
MIACGWAAVAIAVVASLASFDMLSYPVLLAGGLAIGLAQSPSQPARAALALVLVGPRKLSNANALNSLALNVTQIVGPAIGGAMIAAVGSGSRSSGTRSRWGCSSRSAGCIRASDPLRSRCSASSSAASAASGATGSRSACS